MRLSATSLETYRLFKTGDWMDFDQLKEELEGRKFTPIMLRGTSLHSVLESPKAYAHPETDAYESHGFRWWAADIDRYVETFPKGGVHEVKAEVVIDTPTHGPVTVVGKADMLDGMMVREFKTTKAFRAEKYMDSIQWRVYLMAFDALACIYTVFEVTDSDPVTIRGAHRLECKPYPAMKADIISLADEFISMCLQCGIYKPLGMAGVRIDQPEKLRIG